MENAVTAECIRLRLDDTFLRAIRYSIFFPASTVILVRLYPDVSVSPPFLIQSSAEMRIAFRAGSIAANRTVPKEMMTEISRAAGENTKERLKFTRFIMERTSTFSSSI